MSQETDPEAARKQLVAKIRDTVDQHDDLTVQDVYAALDDRVDDDATGTNVFAKLLGLGVGGALLADTAAAGWSIIQPRSQGASDINADTLDGVEASQLGRDVKRDKTGAAQFTTLPTATTNTTQTGVGINTSVSTSTVVVFDTVIANLAQGTGNITISRNSTVVTNITGLTTGNSLTAQGTPQTNPVTWTLNASITTFFSSTTSTTSASFLTLSTSGMTASDTRAFGTFTANRSGNQVYGKATITSTAGATGATGTLKILFNGTKTVASTVSADFSQMAANNSAFNGTLNTNVSTGGVETVSAFMHISSTADSNNTNVLGNWSAQLQKSYTQATATLTAKRNEFRTVY